MPNSTHPLDLALDLASLAREQLLTETLQGADLHAVIHDAIAALDELRRAVKAHRDRQYAADAFVRNGPTRHTQDRFRDAGAVIVHIDDYRKRGTPQSA